MEFKRQRFTPRMVTDLRHRAFVGIGFYIITLVVVLTTSGYYLRYPQFSSQFFLLISGICFFRFVHHLIDRWIPLTLYRVSLAFFLGSICLTGLIWGIGFSKIILQEGEQNFHILMVICTIGLCSGGVVAYVPSFWLAVAFDIAILGPGIVAMAVGQIYSSLMILLVLYLVYMIFMALRGNREYWNALENEFLLEEKTRAIELLGQRDGLTGLYNRRYFDDAFEYEWNRAIRNRTAISIVMCDIDYFKRVNDAFGHLAGDAYLRLTADVLKQVVRRETDIVARYGGEEFIFLIPDDSLENTVGLAERIRQMMENTALTFDGQIIRATVSLGVARLSPRPFEKKETIVSNADNAMYQAKSRGRNRVVAHGTVPDVNNEPGANNSFVKPPVPGIKAGSLRGKGPVQL
ncbi:ABC-type nitrate/sulfonate/bicarbonate transport system, periplasmic substrate binding component [Desulforapulum autotrophicum HRM2]|uniref:diguanylate cyclase n=1 Tax=Desulforapulum autotrophicum (strain ATCC 43914 / DSM 3382 / VKM B-1955 / HRM2) TaxID=177437 RepID=C0QMB4_DESAH|nr:GGDEF domain-containing protein [Desulforapulum autotrophicum]ACN16431.1 ABC-type nitrate/sulfonate/bicarbonate transport system, periplasmic substrate binding component [Desulforapulum autotrophicum HRM2]